MSIMDFFASQGTAQPSTGSSRGNWKDWFLDMEGRQPFGRTISPDDDERGDWMDWFLNREGPAGRFRGSRRPRYGINYLFNGGGSVRSRPSNLGHDRAGPTRVERVFQDNTIRSGPEVDLNFLRNLQQGPGVIDRTIRDRTPPGGGVIKPRNPALPPWYNSNIGEDSFWNVSLPSEDNTGVMAASSGNDWLANNTWMLDIINKRHPGAYLGPGTFQDRLEELGIGGGGLSILGGKLRPTWGDGQYGLEWSIGG